MEANGGAKARPGVTIVPDVQFVARPAAARPVPDALVLLATTIRALAKVGLIGWQLEPRLLAPIILGLGIS